jgi:hypothetical protein
LRIERNSLHQVQRTVGFSELLLLFAGVSFGGGGTEATESEGVDEGLDSSLFSKVVFLGRPRVGKTVSFVGLLDSSLLILSLDILNIYFSDKFEQKINELLANICL